MSLDAASAIAYSACWSPRGMDSLPWKYSRRLQINVLEAARSAKQQAKQAMLAHLAEHGAYYGPGP